MIKLFYSKYKNGHGNFGDELSPLIIEEVFNEKVVYASLLNCDLVALGSVLDNYSLYKLRHLMRRVPRLFRKVDVWGSGFLHEENCFLSKNLKFHAVRGQLALDKISHSISGFDSSNIALGDPGVFANRLLKKEVFTKKHFVGFLPHYVDANFQLLQEHVNEHKNSVILDITAKPLDLIKQISECELIISTSLHGLVTADSLGIPNIWATAIGNLDGGNFKFHDYYSVIDTKRHIPWNLKQKIMAGVINEVLDTYKKPDFEKIREDLFKAFPFK